MAATTGAAAEAASELADEIRIVAAQISQIEPVITELLSVRDVAAVAEYSDILQIGARNMQNFPLLRSLGQVKKPVLLKRGMMATVEEYLMSAEYILAAGNPDVILCERGIRTFETATRFTLDLNAVPAIQERSHLPVIVDPSHGTGVWRYIAPLSKAAVACGAAGLMVEVHPHHLAQRRLGGDAAAQFREARVGQDALAEVG